MSKCRKCKSSTLCTDCGVNTFFNHVFVKCYCDGNWVTGGCTSVKYCTEVDAETVLCLNCSSLFSLDPISHQCVCSNGVKGINGICAYILGCITGSLVNGVPACITCNSTAHMIISNNQCECMQGTTLYGS